MNLIRNLSQRIIIVYLILMGIFLFMFQGKDVLYKVQLQTLNRIKPESLAPLKDAIQKQIPISLKALDEYIFYYERIAMYVRPLTGDIFGILGYCYYLSGDIDRAKISFEKAMSLSPQYFWYPYNLGLLSLQKKDMSLAVEYFKRAQKANTEKTILMTASSFQIYMPLAFNQNEEMIYGLARRLDEGFHQTNVLLLYSYYQMGYDRDQLKDSIYWREAEQMIQSGLNNIKIQVF